MTAQKGAPSRISPPEPVDTNVFSSAARRKRDESLDDLLGPRKQAPIADRVPGPAGERLLGVPANGTPVVASPVASEPEPSEDSRADDRPAVTDDRDVGSLPATLSAAGASPQRSGGRTRTRTAVPAARSTAPSGGPQTEPRLDRNITVTPALIEALRPLRDELKVTNAELWAQAYSATRDRHETLFDRRDWEQGPFGQPRRKRVGLGTHSQLRLRLTAAQREFLAEEAGRCGAESVSAYVEKVLWTWLAEAHGVHQPA